MPIQHDVSVDAPNIRIRLNTAEDFGYIEAHYRADSNAIRLGWSLLDALGYEPIPEDEIEPEETEPGWTKIYAYLKEV